jgi:hypothetical protein
VVRRKLGVLGASMAFALSLLGIAAGPVAAVDPVPLHGNQGCLDVNRNVMHSGQQNTSTVVTGVYGEITAHFDTCDGAGDDDHAVAAWVALTPYNACSICIVQAGLVACKDSGLYNYTGDPCYEHPDQIRFFWAAGGCTIIGNPATTDLGPASANVSYNFQITFNHSTSTYTITTPAGVVYFTDTGSSATGCFNDVDKRSQMMVEKWDRGDSSGGSTSKTSLGNLQFRLKSTGLWQHVSRTGNCPFIAPSSPHTSYCTMSGASMYAWD